MSVKILKFNNIILSKKTFHKLKEPIDLFSVNIDRIVVSEGFKYFTGYLEDELVKQLCIILHQMRGYINYFENGGKNVSF